MPVTSPYIGLIPFSEEQAAFFFGRDLDCEIITANLLAARLTLLYGASGVGKSSVLNAGVVYHLRRQAREQVEGGGRPEFVTVVFRKWRDDPLAGLEAAIRAELGRAVEPASGGFLRKLQAWSRQAGGDLLIVLDQFEEYLLYHPQEDGEGTFAVEFPRAVNRADLRVSFLVSIREDLIAGLDRFKGRIPCLFENYLRIDHLKPEAAREAIEGPIRQFNRMRSDGGPDYAVEPELVEEILQQVRTGSCMLGEAGQGSVPGWAQDRIQTPYLQLVMMKLWEQEMAHGSRLLRLETLRRLGGAEHIVRNHLDEAIAKLDAGEREIASRIFRHLVTRAHTKIAYTLSDLAEFTELRPEQVEPVLEKLSAGESRILAPVAPPPNQPGAVRYQIYHDVLAASVLDWRTRFEQVKAGAAAEAKAAEQARLAAEETRKAARLRTLSWSLTAAVLMVLAATVVSLTMWRRALRASAETDRARAEIQELSTRNVTQTAELLNAEARRNQAEAAMAKAQGKKAQAESLLAAARAANQAYQQVIAEARRNQGESDLQRVARMYYVSPYSSGFSLWYSGWNRSVWYVGNRYNSFSRWR